MESSIKRLGITGVGGFIGARLAARAKALGVEVRGIDLEPAGMARAQALGVEVRRGDITKSESTDWLAENVDVLVHAAAVIRESGAMDEFRRINVEGTRTVGRSASQKGVRRLIHLSSVMVYGFDFPADVSEDGPLRGEGNPYCTTKIESEQVALEHQGRGEGLEVVVLRPGDVYGPRSHPWVIRPVQLMRQGLFFLPDGGTRAFNHLHVDNLVDAVLLAAGKDVAGEIFNVTDGATTTCAEYFSHLARAVGIQHLRSMPAWLLRGIIGLVDRGHRVAGRPSPATAEAVQFLRRPHRYSISRARERLEYSPKVGLEEGMDEVKRWLQSPEGKTMVGSA